LLPPGQHPVGRINFILSSLISIINWTSSEEMGGKYDITIGPLAYYLTGIKRSMVLVLLSIM
jgi:hypothetical protein